MGLSRSLGCLRFGKIAVFMCSTLGVTFFRNVGKIIFELVLRKRPPPIFLISNYNKVGYHENSNLTMLKKPKRPLSSEKGVYIYTKPRALNTMVIKLE